MQQGLVRPDQPDTGESTPSSAPSWGIHSKDVLEDYSVNTEL